MEIFEHCAEAAYANAKQRQCFRLRQDPSSGLAKIAMHAGDLWRPEEAEASGNNVAEVLVIRSCHLTFSSPATIIVVF